MSLYPSIQIPFPGVVVSNTLTGTKDKNLDSPTPRHRPLDTPGCPGIDCGPLRHRIGQYHHIGGAVALQPLVYDHPDLMWACFRQEVVSWPQQSHIARSIAQAWHAIWHERALEYLFDHVTGQDPLHRVMMDLEGCHILMQRGDYPLAREQYARHCLGQRCQHPLVEADRLVLGRRLGFVPQYPSDYHSPTALHTAWLRLANYDCYGQADERKVLLTISGSLVLTASLSRAWRRSCQQCIPYQSLVRTDQLLNIVRDLQALDLPRLALALIRRDHVPENNAQLQEAIVHEVDLHLRLGYPTTALELLRHIEHPGLRSIRRARILTAVGQSQAAIAATNQGIESYEMGPLPADEHLVTLYVMSTQQCLNGGYFEHARGNLSAFWRIADHADSSLQAMAELLEIFAMPSTPRDHHRALYQLGERLRQANQWRFLLSFHDTFAKVGVIPSRNPTKPKPHSHSASRCARALV